MPRKCKTTSGNAKRHQNPVFLDCGRKKIQVQDATSSGRHRNRRSMACYRSFCSSKWLRCIDQPPPWQWFKKGRKNTAVGTFWQHKCCFQNLILDIFTIVFFNIFHPTLDRPKTGITSCSPRDMHHVQHLEVKHINLKLATVVKYIYKYLLFGTLPLN